MRRRTTAWTVVNHSCEEEDVAEGGHSEAPVCGEVDGAETEERQGRGQDTQNPAGGASRVLSATVTISDAVVGIARCVPSIRGSPNGVGDGPATMGGRRPCSAPVVKKPEHRQQRTY